MTRRVSSSIPSGKVRADARLVDLGLAPTRTKAQALVLAGQVYLGEQRVEKPGQALPSDAALRVRESERFVSRGGYKLDGALTTLSVDVSGRVCVDVGASTGGFSDCLLQRGASRVYAVDVGEHQLAARLLADPRVVVMDRTNARFLTPESFPEPIQVAVVDASFIGIEKLLPALSNVLAAGAEMCALIKPQFEAGREQAAKSRGVIRDPALRESLIETARSAVAAQGFTLLGGCDSSLAGPKGNVEYFVWARRS